jgi:hypothetical protein
LAVNAGAFAWPWESVATTTVLMPVLENVPLAPLLGALNVTFTPASGEPPETVTLTAKLVVNGEFTLVV